MVLSFLYSGNDIIEIFVNPVEGALTSALYTILAAFAGLIFKFQKVEAFWIRAFKLRMLLWITGVALFLFNDIFGFMVGYFIIIFLVAHWPLRAISNGDNRIPKDIDRSKSGPGFEIRDDNDAF